MLVTVYGTLKKGYNNDHYLTDAEYVGDCVVSGFKLYNSGFPVAVHSEGTSIRGEIYDIGDPNSSAQAMEILYNLDMLEGYRGDREASSMYIRKVVNAYADDGEIYDTHMYVGNGPFWRNYETMKECPNDDGVYIWGR